MKRTCKLESCDRNKVKGSEYCRPHDRRVRLYGDPKEDVPIEPGRPREQSLECSVDGCGRETYANDLCKAHYQRLRLKGDVMAMIPIRSRSTGQE